METVWRIFQFPMHGQSHIVFRLPVHLENWHNVTYNLGDEDIVIDKDVDKVTQLTVWFNYNRLHPSVDDKCHKILYPNFPMDYRFIPKQGYQLRKIKKDNIVSRMYNYSPTESERYFLKILLLKIAGTYSDARIGVQNANWMCSRVF